MVLHFLRGVVLFLFLGHAAVFSENWSQFRGPNASGWMEAGPLPDSWDTESQKNIVWSVEISGVGHSSPAVWGNRVFITTALGDEWNWHDDSVKHVWKLLTIDSKTGKVVWEQKAAEGLPKTRRHEKASQANSTPVTDGKYIAAVMGSEGLFVYSMDGKFLWKKELGLLNPGLANDPTSNWGHASSPIIYKNLLIVQCDKHADSFVAAFNLADGKEVWRTPRPDELPSWSTPTLHVTENRTEVITSGQYYRGYDVLTGKELWRFADPAEVKQPTPFVADHLIYLTGGYPRGRPFFALRTGAAGDISLKQGESQNQHVAWRTERGGPYTPTPIVYKGHFYSVANNGVLTCYDAKTGEKNYEVRLDGDYSASPVASDGKLFFTSEDGVVSVVQAGPKFQLLSKNDMESAAYATPAISSDGIFVRTLDHLFLISSHK